SEVGMSPYDQATSASRSTTLMGLAVLRAARDVRDQLLTIGARLLESERPALTLRDERIVSPRGERTYGEAVAAHFGTGGELIGRGPIAASAATLRSAVRLRSGRSEWRRPRSRSTGTRGACGSSATSRSPTSAAPSTRASARRRRKARR